MRRTCYILLTVGIIPLLFSCNPQPGAPALLREAERLAESRPDSAMLLVDSISYPEKSLGGEEYMRYLVTRVRVRYKNHRDITGDTLVFDAVRYFTKHDKNPGQSALAQFYGGCVLREQKLYDRAMQYYKEAETSARKAKDVALQGLIAYNTGDLLAGQGLHAKAAESYKTAVDFYEGQPIKQAHSLSAVGRMLLLEGKSDSAFLYFHKGGDMANRIGDKALQSLLQQNLSVAYQETGMYEEAEKHLRLSLSNNRDSSGLARYYLNFAELYSLQNKPDSTGLYIGKLKQTLESLDNTYFKASAYRFLAVNEKNAGRFDAAFNYQDKYTKTVEEITRARLQQSVYEVQQKYNYEKNKNRHQQITNRHQWGVILLLVAVIIGGAVFTWYAIRQKNRILNTQKHIDTLRKMAKELNKLHEKEINNKDKDLYDLLLWKFDVVKKASLLSTHNDSNNKSTSSLIKKFHEIVYGGSVDDLWAGIQPVFEETNAGISQKIRMEFPQLSEPEYRITLLTYAGMNVKEIAVILHLSPNTVQTYRTAVRKKLRIADASADTALYLKMLFEH